MADNRKKIKAVGWTRWETINQPSHAWLEENE